MVVLFGNHVMQNSASLKMIDNFRWSKSFIKPAYGSYCFAHIPDTIAKLFGLPARQPLPADVMSTWEGYDCVVLFFIDAFGWRFFEQYADRSPFLKEMLDNGVVSQMTSMFPSTTAAHATTIHTGLDVSTSGVHEWYYYDPVVGRVIAPLLFSLADGTMTRETLVPLGVHPSDVFPSETIYARLAEGGVQSFVSQHFDLVKSSYGRQVLRGAQLLPYGTWSEALTNLGQQIEATQGKRYFMLYFSAIDSLAHRYSPDSPHVEAEIETFLMQMDSFFRRYVNRFKKTLFLITADHGQVAVLPPKVFYVNQHVENLERYLKPTITGEPIYFGGSPRDLFLYVQDEHLAEVEGLLKACLEGIAEVYPTETLIQQGFFGAPPIGARLAERLGNLTLLPHEGEAVYWYMEGRFAQHLRGERLRGEHGGLAPKEMLIPFMAYASS
jgi:predicted AlkP superfamily pyrophosphatase or phosphodiesterase